MAEIQELIDTTFKNFSTAGFQMHQWHSYFKQLEHDQSSGKEQGIADDESHSKQQLCARKDETKSEMGQGK